MTANASILIRYSRMGLLRVIMFRRIGDMERVILICQVDIAKSSLYAKKSRWRLDFQFSPPACCNHPA
jgi:hypothetical protein